MAGGYAGDSILKSRSDIGCMAIGFWLARKRPWRASVALGIALELIALVAIRDNLTLNVLMLVWPIEAVRAWQAVLVAGGGKAAKEATMNTRLIPTTGEKLHVVGLGTWQTFDGGSAAEGRAPLKELLRLSFPAGGTRSARSPLYGP